MLPAHCIVSSEAAGHDEALAHTETRTAEASTFTRLNPLQPQDIFNPPLSEDAQQLLMRLSGKEGKSQSAAASSPHSLTALSSTALAQSIEDIHDLNEYTAFALAQAGGMPSELFEHGLASALDSMDVQQKIQIAFGLVSSGTDCRTAIRYLHVPAGEPTLQLERQVLHALGLPMVREGATCYDAYERLGIWNRPSMREFELAILTEIAIPRVRAGEPYNQVRKDLGVLAGNEATEVARHLLIELCLPRVHAGERCGPLAASFGIFDREAISAFYTTVLQDIGLPRVRQGTPCLQVLDDLGISRGPARAEFLRMATEIDVVGTGHVADRV